MVKNGTITYTTQPPAGTEHVNAEKYLKYHEEDIDLDNVPLNGGFLIKTLYLSSDPYMTYRMRDPKIPMFCPALEVGKPIDNFGVGVVLRSENPEHPVGSYVEGYLDFQQYSIWPGPNKHFLKYIIKLDKHPKVPLSAYTGALGLAGKTAYSALEVFGKEKAKAKESKTLFVSGGAGPVGTFVIQYAKILNPSLKVIASAGSSEKVQLMKEAGADVPFNYKETDTAKVLREHGPIDIYWDNVAGSTLDATLLNMNMFGLVICCGAITSATKGGAGSDIKNFEQVFQRSLTLRGFTCGSGETAVVLPKFYDIVAPLVAEGKITVREHRYNGLEQTARAFDDHHKGANLGKSVIVIAEE